MDGSGTVGRTRRRGALGPGAAGLAAVAAVAALTAGCSGAAAPTARPSASATASRTAAPAEVSVAADDLRARGFTTVYQQLGNQAGSMVFAAIPRVAPGTLGVGARCNGTGTITLKIDGVLDFDVRCGDPNGELVDYADPDARTDVRAQVISHTTGRWSFSLAWRAGSSAPTDDSAADAADSSTG